MRTPRTYQVKQIIHAELTDARSKIGAEVKGWIVIKKSKKKVVHETKEIIVVIDCEQLEEKLITVIFV
jgi:hypothetical protein